MTLHAGYTSNRGYRHGTEGAKNAGRKNHNVGAEGTSNMEKRGEKTLAGKTTTNGGTEGTNQHGTEGERNPGRKNHNGSEGWISPPRCNYAEGVTAGVCTGQATKAMALPPSPNYAGGLNTGFAPVRQQEDARTKNESMN